MIWKMVWKDERGREMVKHGNVQNHVRIQMDPNGYIQMNVQVRCQI